MSGFLLHSPPVHLSASLLLFELKTGNLQDVEEAVAHHTGNGIIHTKKALSKPGERQRKKQAKVKVSPVKTNTHTVGKYSWTLPHFVYPYLGSPNSL